LPREDGVGKAGVRQAATVEVLNMSGEAQVAVGAGKGRDVGVAVERDREGQGDGCEAVIRVVADVGRGRDEGSSAIGKVVVAWTDCRCRGGRRGRGRGRGRGRCSARARSWSWRWCYAGKFIRANIRRRPIPSVAVIIVGNTSDGGCTAFQASRNRWIDMEE